MSPMRKALLITAAATMLAAACASSHATELSSATQTVPTTTTPTVRTAAMNPKQAAIALGQHLLGEAVLPPGARVSTAPPPAHLDGPQSRPAMGNLVLANRLWSVPGAPDAVQHWLEAHVPPGFTHLGSGSTSGPGYRIVGVGYDLARLPANTSIAEMQLSIAPDGSNSIVRVDTLVGWTKPRPAGEFVAAKDRTVIVKVVHSFGASNPVVKTVVSSDPKIVGPIVKAFNALAVSPPDAVHGCPAITTKSVEYETLFSTAPKAKPDITTAAGSCYGVSVWVGGRTAPNLGEFSSYAFATAVAHALGLSAPHFN